MGDGRDEPGEISMLESDVPVQKLRPSLQEAECKDAYRAQEKEHYSQVIGHGRAKQKRSQLVGSGARKNEANRHCREEVSPYRMS